MPLWQRLAITLATMLLTSFVAGLVWRGVFNAGIPSVSAVWLVDSQRCHCGSF